MPRLTDGMEAQAALVGADRAVHLDAEAAVDADLALVVDPGDAEHDDALGLDDALEDLGVPVLRVAVEHEGERLRDLLHRLVELGLRGVLRLDLGHHRGHVFVHWFLHGETGTRAVEERVECSAIGSPGGPLRSRPPDPGGVGDRRPRWAPSSRHVGGPCHDPLAPAAQWHRMSQKIRCLDIFPASADPPYPEPSGDSDIMVMKGVNPYEMAQAQFDKVAAILDLDPATRELLRQPLREYSFAHPGPHGRRPRFRSSAASASSTTTPAGRRRAASASTRRRRSTPCARSRCG